MSKITKFKRIYDYTATWAAGVLTVTTTDITGTATPHFLVSGTTVDIQCNNAPQLLVKQVVTTTGANTFTIAVPNSDFLKGKVTVDYFSTGQSGLFSITSPQSNGLNSIVQSFVTGTGGAVYVLAGSLDGIHWNTLATITHLGTTGDTQFTSIPSAWAYMSINVTSIGAATRLEANFSN